MKAVREACRSPAASPSRTSATVATTAPGLALRSGSRASASFSASAVLGSRQSGGALASAASMSTSSIALAVDRAPVEIARHQHVDAGDPAQRRARRLEGLAGETEERIDRDEVLQRPERRDPAAGFGDRRLESRLRVDGSAKSRRSAAPRRGSERRSWLRLRLQELIRLRAGAAAGSARTAAPTGSRAC